MKRFALAFYISSTLVSVVNSIQLLPRLVNVVENSSVTLTCSKDKGFIIETIWTNSQITENANLYLLNGQCIVTRFLLQSVIFDGVCNDNGTYSVILKKVDRKQHGAEWMCTDILMQSNIVSIHVSVPAVNVVIRAEKRLYIRENQKQTVRCQTSPCRPNPTIKWYLRHSKANITYDITDNSTESDIPQEYGLIAAESILEFFPNRTIHNWHLFCEVWTQVEHADILSKDILVNVLFPPSEIYFTTERGSEGGTIVANNGEEVIFICVTDSNLTSDIIIRDQRNIQLTTFKNTSIANHTIHKVSCDDAGEYTCYARNTLTAGQEANSKLILVVKCPPRPITVKDGNVTAFLQSDVTLQFIAHDYFDEKNKTVFTWYKQNMSLQNGGRKHIISSQGLQSVLIIRNVTQTDYGQYRIVVRNTVGQYIHYYELHKKEQHRQMESTITGIIIGAVVGTFVFTVLVVVLALIGYKYVRRNNSLERNVTQATGNETVSENQTTSTYDDINFAPGPKTVYEQLDDKGRGDQAYLEIQTIKTEETSRDYINMTV